MNQTDVKAAYLAASGAVLAQRARLKGLLVVGQAGATGSVIVYDNPSAASGNILFQCQVLASTSFPVLLPGEGIVAVTGLYVSMPASVSVTTYYA
jgi:hypothetical protein